MNMPVIGVGELNSYIKTMFDSELMMRSLFVGGEISNLSVHAGTGHIYFSLKDEKASIKAVMFSADASKLAFRPENGMHVTALGRVSVFERDGVYQLYVKRMQPDGAGALAVAFEQLKKKLSAEGLFDPSRKKPIPRYPKKIGVITSPTGAAVRDIFSIIERRYPFCTVVFCPVTVQGSAAAAEMIAALQEFGQKKCADVIIIGRGGGSAEDLWCFNDEMLARAVAACPVPVISGVGHETDFTICDFVSDVRAATPSAAAEIATPDGDAMKMETASLTERLYGAVQSKILAEKRTLETVFARRNFFEPSAFFADRRTLLGELESQLSVTCEKILHDKKLNFSQTAARLDSLNPLSVLTRGFAAVSVNGAIADSVSAFSVGDRAKIRFADGTVEAEIIGKVSDDEQ